MPLAQPLTAPGCKTAGRPTSRTPGAGVPLWTFVLAATVLSPLRTAGLVLAALLALLAAVAVPALLTGPLTGT